MNVATNLPVDFIFGYDLLQAQNAKINIEKNAVILESSLGLIHVDFLKQSDIDNKHLLNVKTAKPEARRKRDSII